MILKELRVATRILLGALTLAAYSVSAQTASQVAAKPVPQITQPIDASVRHVIANSVPAQVRSASDQGRAPGALPLKDMILRLKPTAAQTTALNKYVADVQNPSSANYHHWLTPAQYGAQFGVTDADAKTVTQWLTSNGFTVSKVANGKNWVRFSGTSSQVESAFATEIHSYSAAGTQQYSNATPLSIPEALSPAVAGLLSANSFTKNPLHTKIAQLSRGANGKMMRTTAASSAAEIAALGALAGNKNAVQPNFTSQSAPEETFLAPGDFSRIYNTTPLLAAGTDGTGTSIAIVGRSDISLSDVESFRTVFGLPFNDPTLILASGDPGVVPGDDEESILDVEWSGAVAPKAQINLVIGASTYSTDGVDISASYIVDNVVAPIMSVSFGSCEQVQSQESIDFYHDLWEQAAAEGISVFVSAGDSGSSGCDIPNEYIATPYSLGVNALASTPFNTAVGGTEFADNDVNTYWNINLNSDLSSVKGYIPEAVWNEACNPYLPVSATNCFYDPNVEGTYAGSGGASSCAVHPDGDTANRLTGLYDCTSGYPKPAWQTGAGVPQDGVRDLPDVSLAAAAIHDGFMICYDGSCQWTTNPDGSISLNSATVIGGTSAASPSMAGIMALVEQKNGLYQGLANYQLYKLANLQTAGSCNSSSQTDPTQTSSCVFNDVTAGSNALSCNFGSQDCTIQVGDDGFGLLSGYSAAAGYDLASGLGSVNAANLVSAWSSSSLVATKATLTVDQTTFAHGTPVNLTSVVAPATGSGTPSGDIVLKAAGTGVTTSPITAETLTAGQFAGPITSLPGGTYSLTAEYGGDATYATSTSAPVTLTVAPEASIQTAATLAPSRFYILGQRPIVAASATTLGTNWFISIGVAGNSGNGIATGSIAINDGAKTIGTYPLDKTGSIYIVCGPQTECDYPLGTVNFTATYSGDSSFNKSTSTFPFTINKGTVKFGIGLSSQAPPAGSTVVAQASFSYDPAVLPTGTVTLVRDDTGAVLATGTIGADGVANIPFIAAAGDYYVDGSYAGDANYSSTTPSNYEELITTAGGAITTSATMTTSSTTSTIGGRTQAVIVVKPSTTTASATIPSGTVTLHTADGFVATPVTLVGGQATTFITWSTAGAEKIYATYDGDANFNGSSTGLATINVSQATPTVQLSALSGYVAVGTQTSITATLVSTLVNTQAAAPTGTVQFFDSLSGAAAVALGTPQPINGGNGGSLLTTIAPVLAAGAHSITAVYSGDANWTTATASAIVVNATTPDFSITATPNPLTITAGQSSAISISNQSVLGFSGSVALSCGTLPVGLSCNTATVAEGATGTITLSSTAPGTVTVADNSHTALFGAAGTVAFAAMLMLPLPKRRRRIQLFVALMAAGLATALMGCGGAGSPKPTALALTSSSSKVASGSSVTLLATINSTNNLTGTVIFLDNGTAIGAPADVTNGVASLSTSTLTVGTHSITAKYSGDDDNLSSQSSDTLNQTVTGTFNLTVNATSGTLTHTVTVPATLQ